MKKKFDFSAEMNEAKTVKSNPHNEFLEEENRLLNLNVKELAKLKDRKSTRLNSSHSQQSRMPSSA